MKNTLTMTHLGTPSRHDSEKSRQTSKSSYENHGANKNDIQKSQFQEEICLFWHTKLEELS
jgi:hypothetical protein